MADQQPTVTSEVPAVEDADDGEWVDEEREIDTEDILDLATQNNILLMLLMSNPQLNKNDPLASPKPLFFVTDFIRRTYTEYIMLLLPPEAVYVSPRVANPYVVQYSEEKPVPRQDGPPSQASEDYLSDVTNWPDEDAAYIERYNDAFGRTQMIAHTLTDPIKGPLLMGGTFDFGEHILEIARMILGGEEEEERVVDKYMKEKGIDLSKK